MSDLKELFNATETTSVRTSSRNLAGTAQLTALANEQAAAVLKKLSEKINDEEIYQLFEQSKSNNGAMDKLVAQFVNFDEIDVEFIKELDESTTDGMLKSQQSKRSRTKSKTMTMDNYKSLVSAAIAEQLIRKATGKVKMAVGYRRAAGSLDYTEEQLEQLKNDQEKLRKEIRNVQSKKSIMKSKADFSEDDERWQKLLEAEQKLKAIRVVNRGTKVVKVDETKDKLKKVLSNVDLKHLKATDSKVLLEQIRALIIDDEQDKPEATGDEKEAEAVVNE